MKELSIEEKAVAYDKVREKIALRFGSNVAEEIFSQFEMSEDERIRKALIKYYSFDKDGGSHALDNITPKQILAWLEKQGEQKSVGFNIGDEITVNGQVCRVVAVDNLDWSKEDEEQLSFCCAAIELSNYSSDEYRNYAISFLESLKDRVQPKEKWSEEDEVTLDFLVDYLLDTIKKMPAEEYAGGLGKAVVLLKNLKDRVQPQPKQEWSEEDEKMMNNIGAYLNRYGNYVMDNDEKKAEEVYKAAEWFNTIKERVQPQSQWKPSDEQMKQLGWIAGKNKDNIIGKELMSLYQDLKKLKE